MNSQFIKQNPIISTLISAVLVLPLVFAAYFTLEPTVVQGQLSPEFTISQTITEEISFTLDPSNVTMDTSLGGLDGGSSNGDTEFTIRTNALNGYNVELSFDTSLNGSPGHNNAMTLDGDHENYFITNLGSVGTENDLVPPTTSSSAALFAYTVGGNNLTTTFADDGSACTSGNTGTLTACWSMPSDAASSQEIISTGGPTTGDGNTNQLGFRVVVGPDPDPALPPGTYTATATLTAAVN